MSEDNTNPELENDALENDNELPSELEQLKTRANQLGISYHPNIGADTLRERINEKLADKTEAADKQSGLVDKEPSTVAEGKVDAESKRSAEVKRRLALRKDAAKLIRVRITCMNPNKREWEGEIFSVSNSVVGTFKKYVPYDVEYHVPNFILKQIRQRQCQTFVTSTDSKGRKSRKGKLIKEFGVEELTPLTEKELVELRQRQAMARGQAID